MPDGSEKWLIEEKGFRLKRGIQNKGEIMGSAKDENGRRYVVKVEKCSLPNCYCAARAISFES